jgi:hypothetical protein
MISEIRGAEDCGLRLEPGLPQDRWLPAYYTHIINPG